jgi:tetratricopeptide (TPR) repeat protein
MSLVLIVATLLMQTGAMVGDGPAPSLGLPMIDLPQKAKRRTNPFLLPSERGVVESSKLANCRDTATSNPDEGVTMATDWLSGAKGTERAQAHLCLGYAYTQSQAWGPAEQAFLSGREEATDNVLTRARLGTMAANAALADGGAVRALAALDRAQADAASAKDAAMTGAIATDRARTLVALKRNDDAAAALADARKATPEDEAAWLLSATLSRRMNHLADAQTQIETAAKLSPLDPEVGLEAGVIAVLAGHEDAARRSWQSVLTASPQSDAGHQAAAYLDQLGPAAAGAAQTPANPANAPSTGNATGANGAPATSPAPRG